MQLFFAVLVLIIAWTPSAAGPADLSDESLNVADPETHPYADPSGGRADEPYSDRKINSKRLYDFYARQADYYMEHPEKRKGSNPLPAYPGLDAGCCGHWGKYNQNNHSDDRVNQIDFGGYQIRVISKKAGITNKRSHYAVLDLGEEKRLTTVFSHTAFSLIAAWDQAKLQIPGWRWGLPPGANLKGHPLWTDTEKSYAPNWRVIEGDGTTRSIPVERRRYRGAHHAGRRTIFQYRLAGVNIYDAPWVLDSGSVNVLTRTLRLTPSEDIQTGGLELTVLPSDSRVAKNHDIIVTTRTDQASRSNTRIVKRSGGKRILRFEQLNSPRVVKLYIWVGPSQKADTARTIIDRDQGSITDPLQLTKHYRERWTERITVSGQRDTSGSNSPLAVDTIPVPHDNPYNSVMMLSGIDFLPNGDAVVSTLHGDIWIVSGLDNSLENVTWERFATGLYKPFGLEVIDGTIHVMTTPYILALHDDNGDNEVDRREVVTHDQNTLPGRFIPRYSGGHDTSYGLEVDKQGNFIYSSNTSKVYRYMSSRSHTERLATGLRNVMAMEMRPDGRIVVGPQEGTWTPASYFSLIQYGDHYGAGGPKNGKITPPTAYVPRGVDNSTGGFVGIPEDIWGPFGGNMLGLSYGYGSQYLILVDESTDGRPQGATVPLSGAFRSGVVRGEFHPKTDHLYVVGTDGWGNYALEDGALHRVRYTGKSVRKPTDFHVFRNGIRMTYPVSLDPSAVETPGNYLVQMWNYEYAKRYGSPEFSVRQPDSMGHDVLTVRSAHLSKNGKRIFLEIPNLRPASVVHVRMHLRTTPRSKGGATSFRTSLFPTVKTLGQRFRSSDLDLADPVEDKPEQLQLRVRGQETSAAESESDDEQPLVYDRKIVVEAGPGLKFNKTRIEAKPGERLAIKLVNVGSMQHNFVLAQQGAQKTVGKAGMKMVNQPDAAARQYVPDRSEVIGHTDVIMPGQNSTVVIEVPDQPGKYPYICTFPGHWQSMQGTLVVKKR